MNNKLTEDYNTGLSAGIAAYTIWGILPIFWKLIQHVPATEILAHRIFWSMICMLLVLLFSGRLVRTLKELNDIKVIGTHLVSGALVSFNWGLYIWSVNAGLILQGSLGYFIAPLINVLLGYIFLKETLSTGQKIAVILMFLAVLNSVFAAGQPPWIALLLALSICFYGLVRKQGKLAAAAGLAVETTFISPFALLYLINFSELPSADLTTTSLLILAGPVTALPLVLFAFAARRLPLKTMGMLQYLAPTGQFLLGTLVYGEKVNPATLVSFAIIWSALLIYTSERYWRPVRTRV